ncbi:rRNA methyltransferase 3, mitochondrial [Nilaparvata lugens]|uniref:rRNA methyltransferase 3, mitochondrial n=1 Tax=Nilaparvata lugens TaxID=108931 RepID=UPI00193DB916|nr:rRNA methyltransferase 3, mitochondrial [Nilaparvata lugens]
MNVSYRFLCQTLTFSNFKVVKNLPRQSAAFRFYSSDAQHRTPVKVYKPDGETEWVPDNKGATANYKAKQLRLKPEKKVIELAEDEVEKSYSDDEVGDDKAEELQGTNFQRLSKANVHFFVTSINKTQARKQREKSGMIMLEGKRLIQDAISAGVIPVEIFFSRKKLVEELQMPSGVVKLYHIPYKTIQTYSHLKTPPGIVAFCKMPKQAVKAKSESALPITIICDNIRDPGNLGGIIRTVAAVGCSQIILTDGCADLWNPSVLRGGAGAHFRTTVLPNMPWDSITPHIPPDSRIFLADSATSLHPSDCTADSVPIVPYFSVDYAATARHIVVVIGGETHGLSTDAKLMARYRNGVRINVPVENQVDSLSVNAALSCILFEIKRQFVMDSASSRTSEDFDQGIVHN